MWLKARWRRIPIGKRAEFWAIPRPCWLWPTWQWVTCVVFFYHVIHMSNSAWYSFAGRVPARHWGTMEQSAWATQHRVVCTDQGRQVRIDGWIEVSGGTERLVGQHRLRLRQQAPLFHTTMQKPKEQRMRPKETTHYLTHSTVEIF